MKRKSNYSQISFDDYHDEEKKLKSSFSTNISIGYSPSKDMDTSFDNHHCFDMSSSSEKINIENINRPYLRWIALAFMSFLVFGNDYCYDLPQALQASIQQILQTNDFEYNLLYSVYSIPNIFLPLIGGFIVDYFGIRRSIILYNLLIIIGQSLYTLGSFQLKYWLMISGRIIIGAGSESLNVAQSTIVNKWFRGKELTTAIGISLCICRLGSALNSFLTPKFFVGYHSLGLCALIGLGFVLFSFGCGGAILYMDKKYNSGNDSKEITSIHDEKVSFTIIKQFNMSFWLLLINGLICFQAFFAFLNIANQYLQLRFSFTDTSAGTLLTIPYIVAGLLTPIFSMSVDKWGHKGKLMIIATLLLGCTHLTLAIFPNCNEPCISSLMPLIFLGVFFALHTSLLIPSVSVITNQKILGTAIGFITAGQNLGLALGPMIVASILNNSQDGNKNNEVGYYRMSIFLASLAFTAFFLAIVNFYYDKHRNGGILEKKMTELANDKYKVINDYTTQEIDLHHHDEEISLKILTIERNNSMFETHYNDIDQNAIELKEYPYNKEDINLEHEGKFEAIDKDGTKPLNASSTIRFRKDSNSNPLADDDLYNHKILPNDEKVTHDEINIVEIKQTENKNDLGEESSLSIFI